MERVASSSFDRGRLGGDHHGALRVREVEPRLVPRAPPHDQDRAASGRLEEGPVGGQRPGNFVGDAHQVGVEVGGREVGGDEGEGTEKRGGEGGRHFWDREKRRRVSPG